MAPVLFVAALLIKLEDRGPVLHRHSVVGRSGVPITVLKLRTMIPNAERLRAHVAALNERTGGPLFKATNDPRVTRIGRVLRATSIDELPQLWNVLNGTMSLVGPRFALPYEVEQFDDELRRRTEMRPGITGLWQSEARDNPSFSVYRRLDLFYVDNWSLSLDFAILANTAACRERAASAHHGVPGAAPIGPAWQSRLRSAPVAQRRRVPSRVSTANGTAAMDRHLPSTRGRGHDPGKRGRILIIVQNLPVPFDRRVWLECGTLTDAGFAGGCGVPQGAGRPVVRGARRGGALQVPALRPGRSQGVVRGRVPLLVRSPPCG